jgi:hypothetical protein
VLIVLKSGSLNLLEPSGPVKACNEIALLSFQLQIYGNAFGVFVSAYKTVLQLLRMFRGNLTFEEINLQGSSREVPLCMEDEIRMHIMVLHKEDQIV